ncbi:MAG: pseudouridine-5'-phosphate glycosidase [Deltaproteobacteria bacterium]|jgi:pseudouridine-5'-phosphate glycosidase|nr:pseudouridine-5'-phosphate glycosidase [Deltaproteobacteria bacterium]
MRLGVEKFLSIAPEVAAAVDGGQAVVALESTLLAHGLPWPDNIEVALQAEQAVRESGAVPATIAVLAGRIHIGLSREQLETVAHGQGFFKASAADLGPLLAAQSDGATTVSATVVAAARAGIFVMATGGIGGVHRGDAFDISCDLTTLASEPVAVVSAGAKSILDLPRTLEYLETLGVPVVGYGTGELPAFYIPHSGLGLVHRVDDPESAARLLRSHWAVHPGRGVLLANPIPVAEALPIELVERAMQAALQAAEAEHVGGKALTPFLLGRIATETGLRSVRANRALIVDNARVAGQIAASLTQQRAVA